MPIDLQKIRKIFTHQRLETIGLMFGLVWSILYPLLTPFTPVDLEIFLDAGSGRDLTGFYYAPWSLPLFAALDHIPYPLVFIIANLLNWGGFVFATYVFKGSKLLLFTSYPFLMLIYYGQIDGLYAFGLAGMYLALKRGSLKGDVLASLFWLIAIIKFYIGIPLGLGILLYYAISLRSFLRVSILVGVYGIISFWIWPNWFHELLLRSAEVPPNTAYSIDLWEFVGPIILILWVPVFLSRKRDFIWWTATWALTVPYLYPWSFVFIIMLPVGLIGWGVQVSYITGFVESTFLQIIPGIIYIRCAWKWYQDRKTNLDNSVGSNS